MADPLTYANSDEYVLVNPNDPKVGHLVYDAPMVDAETKQFIRDPETGKIKVYRMVIWGTKGLTQAQVEALITQKNATLVTRINNLDSTLTNFLDADDTTLDQLSELVVAIKANKTDIASLVTDIGKLIDPVSHLPIEATTASVGVVQLATAQDITNGTAGKVVDAQELNNFAQTLPAANGITDVSSGDNSNQLVVSRIGGSKTLTIDNVEHAGNADTATTANSVAWGNVNGRPTKVSQFTNDSNYITGITKAMVTTALGYTPPTSDTNTHYTTTLYAGAKDAKSNAATTNGNTYIKLYDDSTVRAQLNIKGSGATTVTTDANGVITISSTDTNTTYSVATTSANGLMSSSDKTKLNKCVTTDSIWIG